MSAAIEKDSVVGLIGTNGAGKTTFINIVTGYIKPDRGSIAYDGRDITRLPPRDITRLGICRSFQIPQLYGSLSVFDNMMVGLGIVLRNAGLAGYFARGNAAVPGYGRPAEEVAEHLLGQFGLLDDRHRNAQVLPGGELVQATEDLGSAGRSHSGRESRKGPANVLEKLTPRADAVDRTLREHRDRAAGHDEEPGPHLLQPGQPHGVLRIVLRNGRQELVRQLEHHLKDEELMGRQLDDLDVQDVLSGGG